ncbi:MAG TPA: hypothetical protein VMX14_13470 [Anaerolineae bacterium]|nr:hypothetical protein [Anaerolineae bacterium]
MPTRKPTPNQQRANGQGLDVIVGLQILQHTSTDAAALVILKAAIQEILTLRAQITTIVEHLQAGLEEKRREEAQLQKAATDLQAKREQHAAEQHK